MAKREDRNLHPLINYLHASQQQSAITHNTHLNILKLASAVFFVKKLGWKYPLPLNHENNVYYVQVVIEDN